MHARLPTKGRVLVSVSAVGLGLVRPAALFSAQPPPSTVPWPDGPRWLVMMCSPLDQTAMAAHTIGQRGKTLIGAAALDECAVPDEPLTAEASIIC